MQKKYLVIAAAAAVAACSGLIAQGVPTPQSVYVRQLPALTQAVQTILEKPNAAPPDIAGVRAVTYWDGQNPIIEFMTGYTGLVPSAGYHGLYYSLDGSPAAFQNTSRPLARGKDGFYWRGEGDDWGKTTRLDDHWFTFEAYF